MPNGRRSSTRNPDLVVLSEAPPDRLASADSPTISVPVRNSSGSFTTRGAPTGIDWWCVPDGRFNGMSRLTFPGGVGMSVTAEVARASPAAPGR